MIETQAPDNAYDYRPTHTHESYHCLFLPLVINSNIRCAFAKRLACKFPRYLHVTGCNDEGGSDTDLFVLPCCFYALMKDQQEEEKGCSIGPTDMTTTTTTMMMVVVVVVIMMVMVVVVVVVVIMMMMTTTITR